VRPDDRRIAFYEELARRGNRGPILELPLDEREHRIHSSPRRILVSAWHRRRTSACFGSYRPPGQQRLEALAGDLPSPAAIAGLADLGFTTVVVHRDLMRPESEEIATRLERGAESGAVLVPLHATPRLAAYVLRPAAGKPR
jgi:hypothetical protein